MGEWAKMALILFDSVGYSSGTVPVYGEEDIADEYPQRSNSPIRNSHIRNKNEVHHD